MSLRFNLRVKQLNPRLSSNDLVNKALNIYNALLNHEHYINPYPSLPEIKTAADKMQQLIAASADGSKTKRKELDESVIILRDLLNGIAQYIQLYSNGSEANIVSTTMQVIGAKTAETLRIPSNVDLRVGKHDGDLALYFKGSGKKVKNYEVRYSTDPNLDVANWVSAGLFSSSRNIVIKDLIPGTIYWVRVRAYGTNNKVTAYSDPAKQMATLA